MLQKSILIKIEKLKKTFSELKYNNDNYRF